MRRGTAPAGGDGTEVTDVDLVRRSAAGDETAFELLVRRHADAVWRFARATLHDDHLAEDAVQDTFLKAHRGAAGFRGDAAVRTWLLTICHRTCIDRLRKRTAEVVPIERLREERALEHHHDLRIGLAAALQALPADERQAFTLVHVLGHSREEAAAIAGVPASTMRSRVARARGRLVDAMRDSSEDREEA